MIAECEGRILLLLNEFQLIVCLNASTIADNDFTKVDMGFRESTNAENQIAFYTICCRKHKVYQI